MVIIAAPWGNQMCPSLVVAPSIETIFRLMSDQSHWHLFMQRR